MPVPEYPIVFDKTDEDGPDIFFYGEDGSLEVFKNLMGKNNK